MKPTLWKYATIFQVFYEYREQQQPSEQRLFFSVEFMIGFDNGVNEAALGRFVRFCQFEIIWIIPKCSVAKPGGGKTPPLFFKRRRNLSGSIYLLRRIVLAIIFLPKVRATRATQHIHTG